MEGLLSPIRNENGYREYTENDLEVLKRIKLLRTLHFSLEEIKLLHTGEHHLSESLQNHIKELELEKKDLEQSQKICRDMQNDQVQYQNLNAQYYLDEIEKSTHRLILLPEDDQIQEQVIPWRRFFARTLDSCHYSSLWKLFQILVFRVNYATRSGIDLLWDSAAVVIMTLFIEPVLLSKFSTTLGKALLGIQVRDDEGNALSKKKAFERTWRVLVYGTGFDIPGIRLYRYWKSYHSCVNKETMEWEYGSYISVKDEKKWHIAFYIGVYIFLIAVMIPANKIAQLPKNLHDITVEQFCDNYNSYIDYYDLTENDLLNEKGKWIERESGENLHLNNILMPDIEFFEKDGKMSGMQFQIDIKGNDVAAYSYQKEMILSILSFVKAQDAKIFSSEIDSIVQKITESPYESFEYQYKDIRITCKVTHSGYIYLSSVNELWPLEDASTSYSFYFSMLKQ